MTDYIKNLILRIEQLESLDDDGSRLELHKLYGKMGKRGYEWDGKNWVLKGEKNES